VTARWGGGYRMYTELRGFTVPSDEPPPAGEDTGPTPTELFLTALASCFGMSVAAAARRRGIALADLAVTVTGTYDGPRYAHIRVAVRSSTPRAELEPLLERAVHGCYVSNTLLHAPTMEFVVGD